MAAVKKKADSGVPSTTDGTHVVLAEKYRLKHLMNIRKAPSLNAEKIGTKAAGSIIDVVVVKDDWLTLSDGSFILFGGGAFAEQITE